jgi:hypothetical protein
MPRFAAGSEHARKPQVSKKKANPEKIVDQLAKMVWEHLNTLPEEEQERRLTAAEGRVANASRAGSRRTSS